MSDASIAINGLEKIYHGRRRAEGDVHALKPLDLRIAPGEVFGLLGPNGAGKTTLVKLLLGIVAPSSGEASIMGRAIGSTSSKELIGYLPENHRYPLYLTGSGVLHYFGRLSGLDRGTLRTRASELLALVSMSDWNRTKVRKYSKGMMQRLGIAQALINDPKVIFLDEPTDGVDPVGRKEIREIILRLRAQGKTIFLNSHLLSEVEMICDRVAILNKGELVRIGTVRELTEQSKRYRIEWETPEEGPSAGAVARLTSALEPFKPSELARGTATIEAESAVQLNAAIDALRAAGMLLTSVTPARQTLEQLFMEIVQQNGDAA